MKSRLRLATSVFALLAACSAPAALRLPAIFSEHMVLQQNLATPIWGWDTPGQKVMVTFAGEKHMTHADENGKWRVVLEPRAASTTPATLTVTGSTKVSVGDVLVGEVWICSGQSNMQFRLEESYTGDIEAAASNFSDLRLITVPTKGTQELQTDFKGEWVEATPTTARKFSAVGYMFGRYLHQILDVPVGVINVSWGGSAAEAWVRRYSLEQDPRFREMTEDAAKKEVQLSTPEAQAKLEADTKAWEAGRKNGAPWAPRPTDWLKGNQRPGNLFAGMLNPIVGYGLKGAIWYQGEANAARAAQYADLFPFLIEQWRKEWGQGDFPFYWVQLADHKPETDNPGADSGWARLRESQTKTLRLPNTGQAVAIDIGEGRDIHPRDKYNVAARLVRWALVRDYDMKFPYRSPEFKSVEFTGAKALVTFDCFGGQLYAFDDPTVRGFAVCGADKVWHWAKGTIRGKDQVEVSSDEVPAPVAVRYAFADNPRCNLYARSGLPATPFRTDDFPPITAPAPVEQPVTPTPPATTTQPATPAPTPSSQP